jgi:hypothetical protein
MKRVVLPSRSPDTTLAVMLDRVRAVVWGATEEQCGHLFPANQDYGQCLSTTGHRPAVPQDAEAVRRALAEAGYQNVVARLARPDDPARPNSVIYAVTADGLCVIGYTLGGHQGYSTGGPYADGRCLEP